MDLSSILGTLLSEDSVQTVSKKTKTTPKQTQSVLDAALPMLLSGLQDQTKSPENLESVSKALTTHGKKKVVKASSFLNEVDADDGAKIVGHLLGDQTQTATQKIANKTGTQPNQVASVLAQAAPLLMSLVGNQTNQAQGQGGAGISDLLGSLLGNADISKMIGGLLTEGIDIDGDGKKDNILAMIMKFLSKLFSVK